MPHETVFVLGAGFTHAFVPNAPLLFDDFKIPRLKEKFAAFQHARSILENELAESANGRVNLERLMTRVSGMPYDDVNARYELALLETALRKSLVNRITDAQSRPDVDWKKLDQFARMVLEKEASIVTFNYDDAIDRALWDAAEKKAGYNPHNEHAWHPDGGYGFYCRPSRVCVTDVSNYMDQTRVLLLKLHGSINWRVRLGEGTTRGPASILHHESWYKLRGVRPKIPLSIVDAHLELDPFIVPPILVKAELVTNPVLSVVWKHAHQQLSAAKTVTFVGYSLPETDLASRILFREALQDKSREPVDVKAKIVLETHIDRYSRAFQTEISISLERKPG